MPVVTVPLAIVIAPAGVGLTFRVTLESVSMERPKLARTMSVLIVVGLAAEAWKDSVRVLIMRADRKTMVARVRLAKRFLLYPPPRGQFMRSFPHANHSCVHYSTRTLRLARQKNLSANFVFGVFAGSVVFDVFNDFGGDVSTGDFFDAESWRGIDF